MSVEWESQSVYQSVSGVVATGAGYLRSISVSSVSGAGLATVYDGLNVSGRVLCRIAVVENATHERRFRKQISYRTGLYVAFDDTNTTADFEIWPVFKGPLPQ